MRTPTILALLVVTAGCAFAPEIPRDPPAPEGSGGASSADTTRPVPVQPSQPAASTADAAAPPPLPAIDAGSGDAGPTLCTRTLSIGSVTPSSPDCTYSQRLAGHQSTFFFPCAGGDGEVTFQDAQFGGTVTGDDVALEAKRIVQNGGCNFLIDEKLKGQLSSGTLKYAYSNTPLDCDLPQCFSAAHVGITK